MQHSIIVLMAEDEALIAVSLEEDLEEAGFEAIHVYTGEAAMAWLDLNRAKLGGVVTDIRLGSGADGWAVARHAREILPSVPIIYMSGDSAHEHSSKGVPGSVMLQKPFASAQLITALSTLLNAVSSQQPF